MTSRKAATKAPPTAAEPPLSPAELRHYTPEEAVDEFHLPIKARTLRAWCHARKVPHNQMGGRITLLPADIRVVQAMFAVAPLDKTSDIRAAS